MVPSVGSMWSEGPSATEIPISSTQAISSTACSTDTSYLTKECKERKLEKRKLENRKDQNKKKQNLKKKMICRKFGVQSGVEANESDSTGDGNGESCL